MISHHIQGSVTTLHGVGGVLGWPLDTFFWALTISWSRLLARVWSGPKGSERTQKTPVPVFVFLCSSLEMEGKEIHMGRGISGAYIDKNEEKTGTRFSSRGKPFRSEFTKISAMSLGLHSQAQILWILPLRAFPFCINLSLNHSIV